MESFNCNKIVIMASKHTILSVCFSCDTLNVSAQEVKPHILTDNITKVMLSRSAQSLVRRDNSRESSYDRKNV
jgi:hypothetical protein